MALLYRFAQLPDRGSTRIFSFVVTNSLARNPERDVSTKDLDCGSQKWSVAFSQNDKVLGVYLVWRSAAQYMKVYVDFTFTLLNREHFSTNESFAGKRVEFSFKSPAQGNRNYIPLSDLYSKNFADSNGEFQLELTMANVRTRFEREMPLRPLIDVSPKSLTLESPTFAFGGFDWKVVIYPRGEKHPVTHYPQRTSVYLVRLTDFDHRCRVRYNMALGYGKARIESGQMEDISDAEGKGIVWYPRAPWPSIVVDGKLWVYLEMLEARTISEVAVQARNPTALSAASCYDRDKQAWSITTDLDSDTVRLELIYKNIDNVKMNHLKYVSWSAYLLKREGQGTVAISLPGAPFSRFYVREPKDDGVIMETSLNVRDIEAKDCPFVTDKGQLRVRIEWNESHLLFQPTYHEYDDVCRIHNHQMRQEIATLQAENSSLERKLFSCQKKLAYAQAQQQEEQGEMVGEVPGPPRSVHSQHEDDLERSASTDSEYD